MPDVTDRDLNTSPTERQQIPRQNTQSATPHNTVRFHKRETRYKQNHLLRITSIIKQFHDRGVVIDNQVRLNLEDLLECSSRETRASLIRGPRRQRRPNAGDSGIRVGAKDLIQVWERYGIRRSTSPEVKSVASCAEGAHRLLG